MNDMNGAAIRFRSSRLFAKCFFGLLMGFDAVLGILCVCDALFHVEFTTGPPIFGTGTSN